MFSVAKTSLIRTVRQWLDRATEHLSQPRRQHAQSNTETDIQQREPFVGPSSQGQRFVTKRRKRRKAAQKTDHQQEANFAPNQISGIGQTGKKPEKKTSSNIDGERPDRQPCKGKNTFRPAADDESQNAPGRAAQAYVDEIFHWKLSVE